MSLTPEKAVPNAKLDPIVFNVIDAKEDTEYQHIIYIGEDDNVFELYESEEVGSSSNWGFRQLTQSPLSSNSSLHHSTTKKKGIVSHHLIYRSNDNRIYRLTLTGATEAWISEDLMSFASATTKTAIPISKSNEEDNAATPEDAPKAIEAEIEKEEAKEVREEIKGESESSQVEEVVPQSEDKPVEENDVNSVEDKEQDKERVPIQNESDAKEEATINETKEQPPSEEEKEKEEGEAEKDLKKEKEVALASEEAKAIEVPASETALPEEKQETAQRPIEKESVKVSFERALTTDDLPNINLSPTIVARKRGQSNDLLTPRVFDKIEKEKEKEKEKKESTLMKWVSRRKPEDKKPSSLSSMSWVPATAHTDATATDTTINTATQSESVTENSEPEELVIPEALPSPPPNPNVPQQVLQSRRMVIKEIIQTEESYVRQLAIVVDIFLSPLRTQQLIAPHQIAAIFSNIEELLLSHVSFLDLLRATANDDFQFVYIFNEKCGFLSTYIPYVNNFDNATTVVRKLSEEIPTFSSFLKKAEENPRCGLQDVMSLLILPIQRIPRYILLFRDLLKHVDKEEEHSLYDLLCQLIHRVKTTADTINEEKRKAEKIAAGQNVLKRIKGKMPSSVEKDMHWQQLHKEGELALINKGSTHEKIYGYLFDTVFITVENSAKSVPTSPTSELKLKFVEELNDMQIMEFFDIDGFPTFKLKKGKRELILGSTDKHDWIFFITQTIQSAKIDTTKVKGELANFLSHHTPQALQKTEKELNPSKAASAPPNVNSAPSKAAPKASNNNRRRKKK